MPVNDPRTASTERLRGPRERGEGGRGGRGESGGHGRKSGEHGEDGGGWGDNGGNGGAGNGEGPAPYLPPSGQPVRLVVWAIHLALPMAGLWLLLTRPRLNAVLQDNVGHFWLIIAVAGVNVVLGTMIGQASARRADARLLLVSLVFLSSAGFFLIHGLTTPKVILQGPNYGFELSQPVGLLIASMFAFASALPLNERAAHAVLKAQIWLRGGLVLLLTGWGVASLLPDLTPLGGRPPAHGAGLGGLEVLGVAMYAAATAMMFQLHRRRPSAMLISLLTAYALLAEATVAGMSHFNWHLSWWLWHLLLAVAFLFVAYSAYLQFRQEGSSAGLFDSVALAATVQRLRGEYEAALEELVGHLRRRADTPGGGGSRVPVATRLAGKFGLTEGQAAVLDRAGTPLLAWQAGGAQPVDATLAPLLTPAMARVAAEQHGSGGWHIALVDAAGTVVERLTEPEGGQGKPLTSTLSVATQKAAQAAVDPVPQGAMLVAIQPSTGDLLAVAQNGAAGADPAVLSGLYPPGSTFKIATATAVLQAGLANSDTVLPCPGEARIGSRTITNDNHFQAGDVPLHTAFARSCNTTLATLAAGLPADGLSHAADQLGINADFVVPGLNTEAGKIEPADSTTQRVEDSIGQGAVQTSPFGLALMTATVASGAAVTPRLWQDLPTTVNVGYKAPPRAVLGQVRAMMRGVVTGGTATTLAGQGAVFGKTGTAQFGPDGTHAHGWFTGYRGDLAFAVLVLSGESSAPALSVAKSFLGA